MSTSLFMSDKGRVVTLELIADLCLDHIQNLATVSLLLDCIINNFDQAALEMTDQELAETAQKIVLQMRRDLQEKIVPDAVQPDGFSTGRQKNGGCRRTGP